MKLPKDFEEYFSACWHREDVMTLLQGLVHEPSVSIRINPKQLSSQTKIEGFDGQVPWCPEGFYLKERPVFTADPLLHAGTYYVQEASSMFLAHVLRTLPTTQLQYVLDLCAAPGGKSTLLRSILPESSFLVSNEPIPSRCQALAENMAKWGDGQSMVTQAYAKDITRCLRGKRFFDLILADVPCSGEGMMRKEEEAQRQWSPKFVANCAALQRDIISDIWPALRPGGILIYSTCTFNPEEDEENVIWIARELGADILPIPVDGEWHISGDMRRIPLPPLVTEELPTGMLPCCHFIPGRVRGEGFFCAVLRKEGTCERGVKMDDFIGTLSSLRSLPTDQLNASGVLCVDLSLSDSIRYLQREAIILPPEVPKGIVQVCYKGHRLGLVKNLGSRANNLYPKEWRIRSSYLTPHTIITVDEKSES